MGAKLLQEAGQGPSQVASLPTAVKHAPVAEAAECDPAFRTTGPETERRVLPSPCSPLPRFSILTNLGSFVVFFDAYRVNRTPKRSQKQMLLCPNMSEDFQRSWRRRVNAAQTVRGTRLGRRVATRPRLFGCKEPPRPQRREDDIYCTFAAFFILRDGENTSA